MLESTNQQATLAVWAYNLHVELEVREAKRGQARPSEAKRGQARPSEAKQLAINVLAKVAAIWLPHFKIAKHI